MDGDGTGGDLHVDAVVVLCRPVGAAGLDDAHVGG
jgi:hypothetical protein